MSPLLTGADIDLHVRLGIDAGLLDEMQVRRVDDRTARNVLGLNSRAGDMAGVLYPYILPGSCRPVTHRVRRDHPELENGKPKNKYLSGYGDRRHLYFATTDLTLLSDATVPVVLVEAEKSALAVASVSRRSGRRLLVVGLGGCWAWSGRIGRTIDANGAPVDETGPSPDFDRIVWASRDTILALDANVATNRQVQAARRALAREVGSRGADVRILALPNEETINGPDDHIGQRGDEAFLALLDSAHPEVLVLDPADPLPSARAFIEHVHLVDGVSSLRHQNEVFFKHVAGAYREQTKSTVRAGLYRFLDAALRPASDAAAGGRFKPNRSKTANVLDALRAVCDLPASFAAPCWLDGEPGADPFTIISCRNGLLHIPTRRLLTPSPRFFTLNSLEFDCDAAAAAPVEWLQFLHDLWGEDQASIAALQEWIGYLLTPDTRFQKIALLVGPKRSGKGTIGRVIRRLLGDLNVCSPMLASMGGQFGLQVLIGKSAATISDARIGAKCDTAVIAERLLSISGEDALSIPRKFLPDWTGKLATRFMLMTNELPRIGDASGALTSRYIVLKLTRSFYGNEDHGLLERLVPELPGILNWAVDGWERLHARGRFIQPEASMDLIQQLEDLGSPISAFLRDRCVVGKGYEVAVPTLFAAWKDWCEQNGRNRPGDVQTFGKHLRAALPSLQETQRRVPGDRLRFYGGVRLRNPGEEPVARDGTRSSASSSQEDDRESGPPTTETAAQAGGSRANAATPRSESAGAAPRSSDATSEAPNAPSQPHCADDDVFEIE